MNMRELFEALRIDNNGRRYEHFLNETFSINFVGFNDQHQNPIGVFIEACPNDRNAFDMLTRINFNLKFIQLRSAFMIIIEIDRWLNALTAQEISKLMSILPRKSFLISFESQKDEVVHTFWKCQDVELKIFSLRYSRRLSNLLLDYLSSSILTFNPVNSLIYYDGPNGIYGVALKDLTDFNNQNLLMIAAGRGNSIVVELLLHEGFDVNYLTLGELAVDFAWNNGHYNIVLMLLMRNSRFPKNFNFMEAPQEIMNFAEFSKNLHTNIIVNDYQNVVNQLNENVNLQYYYGTDNISALARAMMNNNVRIANLLMSRNITVGPNERYFVDSEGFFRVERLPY